MSLPEHPGLIPLDDLELASISGASLPAFPPVFPVPGSGGEVHGSISGPPMAGELGGSYTGPRGGRFGASVTSDGRDWMAGASASGRSRSGNSAWNASAFTNGHDWGVKGTLSIRF